MNPVAITTPGPGELVIILLIFVMLFGAKKLPELGGSIGKTIKNFKRGVEEGQEDDGEGAPPPPSSQPPESSTPASRDVQ
ncbi:MAG: twin-arginine translocase TatA/TatE family subunit [Euzebyales bacterium]|nr:twin-arginine translocase TatA/TatE family subunit [Euzebyales bacterium]